MVNRRQFLVATLALALLTSVAVVSLARAAYTTTIVNRDAAGNHVTRYDTAGNALDAHDGDLALFGDTYHLYGTSYDCGYGLQVNSTRFCGFKVHSSPDLEHWTDRGTSSSPTPPPGRDVVLTRTVNRVPGAVMQSFPFTPVTAQFVRIRMTKLSNTNPNDPTFRAQFAEVEVYKRESIPGGAGGVRGVAARR